MVGMWTPEPPQEQYNENLSTAEAGIVVVEQDSSDSEDENPVHSGYQLLAQAPSDLLNTVNEDLDVSDLEQWFPFIFLKGIINL
jgi:hypothetical protein